MHLSNNIETYYSNRLLEYFREHYKQPITKIRLRRPVRMTRFVFIIPVFIFVVIFVLPLLLLLLLLLLLFFFIAVLVIFILSPLKLRAITLTPVTSSVIHLLVFPIVIATHADSCLIEDLQYRFPTPVLSIDSFRQCPLYWIPHTLSTIPDTNNISHAPMPKYLFFEIYEQPIPSLCMAPPKHPPSVKFCVVHQLQDLVRTTTFVIRKRLDFQQLFVGRCCVYFAPKKQIQFQFYESSIKP